MAVFSFEDVALPRDFPSFKKRRLQSSPREAWRHRPGANVLRQAVRDALTEIQDGDFVGYLRDEIHIVVDDQDGEAVPFKTLHQPDERQRIS